MEPITVCIQSEITLRFIVPGGHIKRKRVEIQAVHNNNNVRSTIRSAFW